MTVVQQLFKRIGSLLNSADENVQIEAGAGLVTFICNDFNYYKLCSENLYLDHEHFRLLLTSENLSIRCNAAFQMIILIRLISDLTAPESIARALLILFRIIGDSHIDDEDKILPTDLIGRLGRVPTGVCEAIITSDGLEHIITLLNSSNIVLNGIAAITIDCLVQDSPEGQRRLLQQCRVKTHYLEILLKYIFEPSVLRTRISELYSSIHHERVHFPPIRTKRQRRSLPTV